MINNKEFQEKEKLKKSLNVDKKLVDRIKNSDNSEELFLNKKDKDGQEIFNQVVIKKRENKIKEVKGKRPNEEITQDDINELDKQIENLKYNDVLNRLGRELVDKNVEETDLAVQAIHSTDEKRRNLKRGTKIISNFAKSDKRLKFAVSNVGYSSKTTLKNKGIESMESEDPTKDTGFTATSRSVSITRTTKDIAQKAREKIVNLQRFKKIKGTSAKAKSTSAAFNRAKSASTAFSKASATVATKVQGIVASKGGIIIGIIFLILMIIGVSLGTSLGGGAVEAEQEMTFNTAGLSEDVLQWENKVIEELEKYNLQQYKDLILVIIEIESGGKLDDVMQSSQSKGLAPNTITDPNESIEVGVSYFKEVMDEKEKYSVDMNTAIQAYNYGKHFISYVANNGGEWTQKLANNFSNNQASKLGWSNYGDKNYLSKVLNYLTVSGDNVELDYDISFDVAGGKLAFPVPSHKTVNSPYGWRIHPIYGDRRLHTGIDIPAPTGTPVIASADGVVTHSGNLGGYGKTVMINHGNNVVTLYAHNSALKVTKGQKVNGGTVIALVGATGQVTGAHSHFEVRYNGKYNDPMKWLQY